MRFSIERVNINNYNLFDDMVFWRENGIEREPFRTPIVEQIKKELTNPNLYIYAARVEDQYVGWISLIYMPKVGKWMDGAWTYICRRIVGGFEISWAGIG